MLALAAANKHATLEIMLALAGAVWVFAALGVASYGDNRGFKFWPLFICALFLGFPLVLLAVTIATPSLDLQWERHRKGGGNDNSPATPRRNGAVSEGGALRSSAERGAAEAWRTPKV